MKKIIAIKRRAPKQQKSNKVKSWVVVTKGDYINAAIDNHVSTKEKLEAMGYTIVGNTSSIDKEEAIDYIAEYLRQMGKNYRRERKK